MIKKILFSLLLCFTIGLTFVATKVSANVPNDYVLIPIEKNDIIPEDTYLYYDTAPTNSYLITTSGIGIAEGYTFIFDLSVDNNNIWRLVVSDFSSGEQILETTSNSDFFLLSTSIQGLPPIAGDFSCYNIIDISGGSIGIIEKDSNPPVDNESNAIYKGVYELLADSLFGGTDNLTEIQVGVLEWFSILITLTCLMLPFIIVFFVIKLLFK